MMLGAKRRRAERVGTDAFRRAGRVDVRVLEQTERELQRENARNRGVEPRLGELAGAHGVDEHVAALRTAELIDACLHGFHEPCAHR